jgi:FAD/FMN-containing dehydrogenase
VRIPPETDRVTRRSAASGGRPPNGEAQDAPVQDAPLHDGPAQDSQAPTRPALTETSQGVGQTLSRPALDRRAFLGVAAAAATAVVAACSPPSPVNKKLPVHSPSPRARRSVPTAADWNALRSDLAGQLVRPGEHDYPTARLLFDPRFDTIRPAGIAYCASPEDVATCLAFARDHILPIAARSGGHSYAGWSSTPGLVIDVTAMRSVRYDSSSGLARVGAGTFLIDLYGTLAAHGVTVPGGSCPNVGIAGLTLGGGVGVVSRAYGLTCDNLESVQIVTADGTIRACDSSHSSDLYWASRGGGGGNFGVATSFTFRTHPAAGLVLFFLSWPWAVADRVVAAWQSWAPSAPDELWSNLHLSASPGGSTPTIQVGGTYLGDAAALQTLLGRLYGAVGSDPSSPYVSPSSYLDAMLVEAGCAQLSVPECHLPWQAAGGRLTRQPELAKSDFFTRPLSSSAIGTLLAGLQKLQAVPGTPGGNGTVAFDACGGAINRVSPGDTAFVHRNALFLAQYTTTWNTGAAASGVAAQRRWQQDLYASMRPYASGQAYQNYIDPGLANWRQAYYGANYTRLSQVKARYDPGHLFTFPQAIT